MDPELTGSGEDAPAGPAAGCGDAEPKLKVRGLGKVYGSVTALAPTDLDVPAGEFLTLLGPSGSGKTTLLQMVCGLVEPSSGRVYIEGRDQTATPVHKRDIGLVFQSYGLFPHLTVAENVAFPLRMRKAATADVDRRVRSALEMVQLGHLGGRFARELSGGQQQRVALARCFVYRPSIILMDEPLGALDKKLREHMQLEIRRLHRESGATVVYVTHDQEEALALSDRICLMNHAQVEQLGTPRDIYARPRTAFAADFIGISNIFRGRITRGPDGCSRLATPCGSFRVDARVPLAIEGGAVVIRPERMVIGDDCENVVTGEVSELIYAGSETRMIVALRDGYRATVRLRPDMPLPQLGDTTPLSWRTEDAVMVP